MLTPSDVADIGGESVVNRVTRNQRFRLEYLIEAAHLSCCCGQDPRTMPPDAATLGLDRVWTWNEAGGAVDLAYGRGAVLLLRSLVSQFRLGPVDTLPPVFFARVLVLMAAGVSEQDVSRWWEMRSPLRSVPLDLEVAADAVTRWGVAFVNDCARAGLSGEDLRRVLAHS